MLVVLMPRKMLYFVSAGLISVFTLNRVVYILLWSYLIKELQNELAELSLTDEMTYLPLFETLEVLN